jgi:hypothetical protein
VIWTTSRHIQRGITAIAAFPHQQGGTAGVVTPEGDGDEEEDATSDDEGND